MKRGLQIVLAILSLIPLYFAVIGVMNGAAMHIPAEHVTPALDNQFRYQSGYYISLFLLLWWIIPNVEKHTTPVRLLTVALFIGGLARAYSLQQVGHPLPEQMIGMYLELGAPLLAFWQAKISA